MANKKHPLPFDKYGRTIVIQKRIFKSEAYLNLSPQSKVLMLLMHNHWRNDVPVAYGVREAQEKIPCSRVKAMECFKELEEKRFIVKVDESLFNSRTGSKSRTWRLTWMPYWGNSPTNDWEDYEVSK